MWYRDKRLESHLTDADWTERATTRLLVLDSTVGRAEAYALAFALCGDARWRQLSPEDAAIRATQNVEARQAGAGI